MKAPSVGDWCFEEIGVCDPERATRLEAAGSSDALVVALAEALENAVERGDVRYGLDSLDEEFVECRAIIQFKVHPNLYDWFFNARTGYRARYWISADAGAAFNMEITEALWHFLIRHLPQHVNARRITTTYEGESREDEDAGAATVTGDDIMRSLKPGASKIWICERLVQHNGSPIQDIGFVVLSDAERNLPKLFIPRWANAEHPKTKELGEGLRAPYPLPECAWLDLKGGYVRSDGRVEQKKSQVKRAKDINQRGWT